MSAAALADRLAKSPRTIERHIADLRSSRRVRRIGSAKAGSWVVTDRSLGS